MPISETQPAESPLVGLSLISSLQIIIVTMKSCLHCKYFWLYFYTID